MNSKQMNQRNMFWQVQKHIDVRFERTEIDTKSLVGRES